MIVIDTHIWIWWIHGHPSQWFSIATSYPGMQMIALTPEIAVDANYLPGVFHKDPADRIIVATARKLECELLTEDGKILAYEGVQTAKPRP